jgi:GR25 family glycosyltransferase involved in LPS biosynthesis
MLCVTINLDRETDRRAALAANFARFADPGWRLERCPAVEAAEAAALRPDSKLRPAETACFLSHIKALEMALAVAGPVMICEDDIILGPRSATLITMALATIASKDWHILFPEIDIGDPPVMLKLFELYRQKMKAATTVLLDPKFIGDYFFSAAAYIVAGPFKQRLLGLLRQAPMDLQYDIVLRRLILGQALRCRVIFPFVTSISPAADSSQIQPGQYEVINLVLNEVRRLLWIDRPPDAPRADLAALAAAMGDADTAHFTRALEIILSLGFTVH